VELLIADPFDSRGRVWRLGWTGLGQPDERLRAGEKERTIFRMA